MAAIRLNIFQKLTRQWDEIHPYNAAQAMQLAGRFDEARVQAAWEKSIASLQLGAAKVEGGKYCWRFENAPMMHRVASNQSLDEFFTEQLNRKFDDDVPLRPFAIDNGGSFCIGVIYHHWIADSVSIRSVLREWFLQIYFPDESQNGPMPIARAGYWQLFGPSLRRWNLWIAMLSTLR